MRTTITTRLRTLVTGLVSALVVAAIGAMAPAAAQIGDSGEPILVEADGSMEFLREEGRLVWSDNVRAVQGGTRITSDLMTIICARSAAPSRSTFESCSEIETVVAEGNVIYTTPEERIRGDRSEYDYRTDTITITGNVILSRGQDVVAKGPKVVYDVANGRATITSEGTGSVLSIFEPVDSDNNRN